MGLFDAYSYKGKRALVVGGATGMGAAVAELVLDAGAEVVVMDRAEITLPGVKAISLNLADKASIDAAVDECGGPVHALFSCAGVADGTPGIEKINFIGHRYMIDRMLAGDMLPSRLGHRLHLVGGRAWAGRTTCRAERVPRHHRLRRGRRSGRWTHASRLLVEQAGHLRVRRAEAYALLKQGIRINAIMPGPDRHAARAGQQGDVARLRCRLPRRHSASRPRRRSSRRTRSCSCAATPQRRSPASR